MNARRFGHAVVLGSGIAGLVASRVLSDFFAQVTLLERDDEPHGFEPRAGAPQGWHFHGLLPGGLRVLQELFPGITDDLSSAGSQRPAPHEIYFFRPEGKSYLLGTYLPTPRHDDGQRLVFVQSRALLEGVIRGRVAALDNVSIRYSARAEGIVADGARVTGARLAGGEHMHADLTIDAMGRGGRTLHWLDELGFERPSEDIVHCDIAYTSVYLRPHDPAIFEDVGFFSMRTPNGHAGGLMRLEQNLWTAILAGRHGDFPARDVAGFMRFAHALDEPLLSQLLAQCDPLNEPACYRFDRSVRRRFERLARFPEGLLPLGDSVCHFNPLYGQGMSAACRQGLALWQILSDRSHKQQGIAGLWRDFFPQAYQETRAPWLFAALADFRDPRTQGNFPVEEREYIEPLQKVLAAAGSGDAEAQNTLLAVQGLLVPLDVLKASA